MRQIKIVFGVADIEESIDDLSELFASLPAEKLVAEVTRAEFGKWDNANTNERTQFRDQLRRTACGGAGGAFAAVVIQTPKGTILSVGKREAEDRWQFTDFDGIVRTAVKDVVLNYFPISFPLG